jgi:hypothetical protein
VLGLLALVALSCSESNGEEPVVPVLSLADFTEPPVEYRAWGRWMWPGADVTPEEIRREVDLMVEGFFGGMEIAIYNWGLDAEADQEVIDRRLSYDSDSFYSNVYAALEKAEEVGLIMDLTFGSGYPLGSHRYTPEESNQTILFGEWSVTGPDLLEIPVVEPKKNAFYHVAELAEPIGGWPLARYMPEYAELLYVLAAKVTGGERTDSFLDVLDTLVLDRESVVDISDQVQADGSLSWDAPVGDWQVIAFFVGPTGTYPVVLAEPTPQYVANHFETDFVTEQLEHYFGERTGLGSFYGTTMTAFFTDSLEFKAERHFGSDMFDEFETRRGYDIRPWLPAVMVPAFDNLVADSWEIERAPEFSFGDSGVDARLSYDFALTVSDLFIERYIQTTVDWATAHNLESRVQAYGMNIDVIRALGAAHIPEAEQGIWAGGAETHLRTASSAGHHYGRNVVSAEAVPSLGHSNTLYKLKAHADKAFTSGINKLIYNNYPYDHPGEYGIAGWMPFCSRYPRFGDRGTTGGSNLGPNMNFLSDMPDYNRYVGRSQYLLRQGEPQVDLLVYYPWLGFPNAISANPDHAEPLLNGLLEDLEPPFGGIPFADFVAGLASTKTDYRVAWLVWLWPLLEDLEARGYSWDWVNDDILSQATGQDGHIVVRGHQYTGLILADSPTMHPQAAENIADLAESGIAVVGLEQLPYAQPGYYEYQAGDQRVVDAISRIEGASRFARATSLADLPDRLAELEALPLVTLNGNPAGLRLLSRRLQNGGLVTFIRNAYAQYYATEVEVAGGCRDAYWMDPWSGELYTATPGGKGPFDLTLEEFESIVLVCGDGPAPDGLQPPRWHRRVYQADSTTALEAWTLSVEGDDVASGTVTLTLDGLTDWRDIEELKHCSSQGVYTIEVQLDSPDSDQMVELDLGTVQGTVAIQVNGQEAGRLVIAPYRKDITSLVQSGRNEIQVTVSLPWRNRLIGYGASGDPVYDNWVDAEETAIATGMLGPANLLIGVPGPR